MTASPDEFKRLEEKVDLLLRLVQEKPVSKTLTMTVGDVQREFGYSQHKQRLSRRRKELPFKIVGLAGIEYLRTDVENWITKKSNTN